MASTKQIKVGALEYILNSCREKAGLQDNHGWPGELVCLLNQTYKDNDITAKYITNLFSKIKPLEKTQVIGINPDFLEQLMRFLNVSDLKDLEPKSDMSRLRVWYVSQPFSLFSLIRLVSVGFLERSDRSWSFHSNDVMLMATGIQKIDPFRMQGDKLASWVRIEFEKGDSLVHAYFKHLDSNLETGDSSRNIIFDFFQPLLP